MGVIPRNWTGVVGEEEGKVVPPYILHFSLGFELSLWRPATVCGVGT